MENNKTTTQISGLTYTGLNLTFGYTYDTLGNISTYTAPDGEVITYTYDALGQLLSAVGDTTYTYTYDKVGNILTANGHTYTYADSGWRDMLLSYDGQSLSYDNSGNPTSYYNGTRWAFTWTNGRNLTTASDGDTSISYTYDAGGLRTGKTVDGVTHSYLYASGKLLRESYGSTTLDFFYDENGRPYAFTQNGTIYYYVTNLQGDVVRILNSNGTTVGTYEYDPYGNVTSMSGALAGTNPIRYRGYYYDKETGFYYLQSRYYDPAIGRFINADGLMSTGQGITGFNVFTYCGNSPSSFFDSSGTRCDFSYTYVTDGYSGEFRDVTEEIDLVLYAEASKLQKKQSYYYFSSVFIANAYFEFYQLVNHNAPWDIKRKGPWEETIGTEYPGFNTCVLYHGNYMSPEYLGNYTYGFLGASLGIPLEILYVGSEYAAGFPDSGEALQNEKLDQIYIRKGYATYLVWEDSQ